MNLNKYQGDAAVFLKQSVRDDLNYLVLGLCGEAGEVAELVKKEIRDGREINLHDIALELGDVLWYVSQLASYFNLSLSEIGHLNLDKLQTRNNVQGQDDGR